MMCYYLNVHFQGQRVKENNTGQGTRYYDNICKEMSWTECLIEQSQVFCFIIACRFCK